MRTAAFLLAWTLRLTVATIVFYRDWLRDDPALCIAYASSFAAGA